MKVTCKYCGIVDKPHNCPHNKRKTDRTRTDKQVYKDIRWRRLRDTVLEDYNYVCLWSLYVDADSKVLVADRVHHIVEILKDESLAFDYDNLIPLEQYNHDKVHELYKKDKLKVQQLLRMMCKDYQNGDRTRGKYKNWIDF